MKSTQILDINKKLEPTQTQQTKTKQRKHRTLEIKGLRCRQKEAQATSHEKYKCLEVWKL